MTKLPLTPAQRRKRARDRIRADSLYIFQHILGHDTSADAAIKALTRLTRKALGGLTKAERAFVRGGMSVKRGKD